MPSQSASHMRWPRDGESKLEYAEYLRGVLVARGQVAPSNGAVLDVAIEVGRERDSLRDELTELRNRHGLLREALAAVRAGEAGPRDASAALFNDAAMVPEGEFYESEPDHG